MEEDTIIIRVLHSGGRLRVSCKLSDNLNFLKNDLAKRMQTELENIILSFDPQGKHVLRGEKKCMSELKVKNGEMLHMRVQGGGGGGGDMQNQQHAVTQFNEDKQKINANAPYNKQNYEAFSSSSSASFSPPPPAPPTFSSSSSSSSFSSASPPPSSSSSAGPPGFHKGDTIEPSFKSFDQFIKERGFIVNDLPHSISYASTFLRKGHITKIPLSITLKHQAYRHVDHLELMNIEGVKNFVNYWRYELDMCSQRAGFMYGYFREDIHYPLGIRAVCEAIYEPPQTVDEAGSVKFLEAEGEYKLVEKIAEHLGLEKIGWIYTHLPRDELLTAHEVVQIAKMQLAHTTDRHFTGYPMSKFVTCTITPDAKTGGEPVPNAFMVSDLGTSLVRDSVLADEQPDVSHIRLRTPQPGELLAQVLESGKETTKFDADWLVVRVNESAPIKVRSIFKQNHFPCENRKTQQKPSHVREYFNSSLLAKSSPSSSVSSSLSSSSSSSSGASSSSKNYERFADFHLLLYVAKLFDLETSLSICDAIKNQTMVDPGLEDILKSMA